MEETTRRPSKSSHIAVDGLVLRRHAAGQDRILTILTGGQGVLTAFAGRAGAMKSKLAAATEPLCYARFILFKGRGGNIVDSADLHRPFFGLRQEYEKLCLGSYFAQLAAELCPHGEPAAEPLRLTLNCLHHLEKGSRPPVLLKALYELRILTLTGFMPDLVACANCGAFEAEDGGAMRFFYIEGELLCPSCANTAGRGGIPLAPGTLSAMRHILYAAGDKLFSFVLRGEAARELGSVCERYLLAQVERTFSALEFYRSAMNAGSE